ncbi:PREDICTED: probable 3-hydroxyisobutyryl-CoA hydrolase 3 isoform X1 [Brassica oleracea var. oleracea]|uniref:probable 3-hydroxyisobutyryl-CoA hydrolase 3 isoform X1 n=1 Tax=Brassica oleracea var. oleracea TaxID=109376 RepID=UPI0006A6AF46|nr:PREDICTED: probable 3-hydroxyisobutyryl-CoA hydrolase 3 isoform X1 [Brassica oleracea var. oleracea]
MASHSQVLMEDKYTVRILTLNRPNQMNALSWNVITRLLQLFLAYKDDPRVKLVILKGQGKSFCAGGDVRPVICDIVQGKWRLGADFFSDQYTLNYVMATYSKIQISIMNGIVMGGGAERAVNMLISLRLFSKVFAMPETELGLFPDVGASYFLSRLPGFFGEYVGLTGARLDGAEMLACGLATHFVPSTRLTALEADLCRVGSNDPDTFSSKILNAYTQHPHLKQHSAYHRLDVIDKCFSRRTVEEIISALEREAIQEPDEWISATLRALKKASPASLKISLRSIREGRFQEVGECLIREYRMVCHVLKGELSKDLVEGCRAVVIDKDRKPKWKPRRLEQVTDNMVDQYFKRMDEEEGWEDLKSFHQGLTCLLQ